MSRRLLAAALCVFLAPAGAIAEPPAATQVRRGVPPQNIERIRAYWKALDLIGFRGVGLVAKDGRIALWKGSGGVAPTATFDIASIAKSLTAVAVLRLARRHELSTDDTLDHFFEGVPSEKRSITVHQLLTHTAGIGNSTGDTAEGITDRDEAVRQILATPLVETPGAHYRYSNDGYTLLAALLEVASKKRWEVVMRDEIFGPAGMNHTFCLGERAPRRSGAVAVAAIRDNSKAPPPSWGAKGGAGIFSTADDLFSFIWALTDGRLLGPDGISEVGKSWALEGQFLQYGRVFSLRSLPGRGVEWSHGGADTGDGHYSMLEYYPDSRLVLVVLALDSEALEAQVATGIAKVIFSEKHMELPPPRPGHPARDIRQTVSLSGAGLSFSIEPGPSSATLLPENPESTAYLVARTREEKAELDGVVSDTRKLLDEVTRRAAADAPPGDDAISRAVVSWREANREDGDVQGITVLGAVPNWTDSLGGTLSFVRVTRAHRTSVFRLYFSGGVLKARGGQAYPNPAPLRLIDLGGGIYGAWNPSLGSYAELRLAPGTNGAGRDASLTAGGLTVTLTTSP